MKLKAFTLVETILYLALFNVIFFTVITWAISLGQSNRNAEYRNALEKNSLFVTEHLTDTYRKGLSIDSANSAFNVSNGKVRIAFSTGFFEYSVINGVLSVTDGTNTFPLTDKFVQISSFTVSPVIVAPASIVGTRISISMSSEKFPNLTKQIESYYALR